MLKLAQVGSDKKKFNFQKYLILWHYFIRWRISELVHFRRFPTAKSKSINFIVSERGGYIYLKGVPAKMSFCSFCFIQFGSNPLQQMHRKSSETPASPVWEKSLSLSTGGTSTGAVVAGRLGMCVFTKISFGDYVLTRDARLAPGAAILLYRDKATVQVYSSRSITGPAY
jgi:hypothetical protein